MDQVSFLQTMQEADMREVNDISLPLALLRI